MSSASDAAPLLGGRSCWLLSRTAEVTVLAMSHLAQYARKWVPWDTILRPWHHDASAVLTWYSPSSSGPFLMSKVGFCTHEKQHFSSEPLTASPEAEQLTSGFSMHCTASSSSSAFGFNLTITLQVLRTMTQCRWVPAANFQPRSVASLRQLRRRGKMNDLVKTSLP